MPENLQKVKIHTCVLTLRQKQNMRIPAYIFRKKEALGREDGYIL
jgi:ribosomal protein L39E